MNALLVAVLCLLAAGGTAEAASQRAGACQSCSSNSGCAQLTATGPRKLQAQQAEAALVCHAEKCVPAAAEHKDEFCAGLAAGRQMQHQGKSVQEGIQLPKGEAAEAAAKPQASRQLLKEASAGRQLLDNNQKDDKGNDGDFVDKGKDRDDKGGHWDPSHPSHGPPPGWVPPPDRTPPPGWHPESPKGGPKDDGNGYQRWKYPGQGQGGGNSGGQGQGQNFPGSNGGSYPGNMGGVSGGQLSYGNSNTQPSLLQRDDEPQSTFFQPIDDGTPKANVLAYGKGYVELQGTVIRVIPHVQNLETCARHCDMDSACTHWRRCAGGDCGARLQECELMSGPSNPATTQTPAPGPSSSRTVAPAVLQQRAPSIRYIDAKQSDAIMESGTKSATEFPKALYGCPYPAQPNGQLGACIPPPQCNCASGVCYGSC